MANPKAIAQSLIVAQARAHRLEEAALFALDVLIACVADGPGCDDPQARQIAIDTLREALAEPA